MATIEIMPPTKYTKKIIGEGAKNMGTYFCAINLRFVIYVETKAGNNKSFKRGDKIGIWDHLTTHRGKAKSFAAYEILLSGSSANSYNTDALIAHEKGHMAGYIQQKSVLKRRILEINGLDRYSLPIKEYDKEKILNKIYVFIAETARIHAKLASEYENEYFSKHGWKKIESSIYDHVWQKQ
jgi:hypothetical protein